MVEVEITEDARPQRYQPQQGRNGNHPTEIPKGANYCWSHGCIPQRDTEPHCSGNCLNRNPGHQEAATAAKKMRGEAHIWIGNWN